MRDILRKIAKHVNDYYVMIKDNYYQFLSTDDIYQYKVLMAFMKYKIPIHIVPYMYVSIISSSEHRLLD